MSETTVKITVIPQGPAKVETERAEVALPDGTIVVKEGVFSLCRCGKSANKPFCDGAHKTCDFDG